MKNTHTPRRTPRSSSSSCRRPRSERLGHSLCPALSPSCNVGAAPLDLSSSGGTCTSGTHSSPTHVLRNLQISNSLDIDHPQLLTAPQATLLKRRWKEGMRCGEARLPCRRTVSVDIVGAAMGVDMDAAGMCMAHGASHVRSRYVHKCMAHAGATWAQPVPRGLHGLFSRLCPLFPHPFPSPVAQPPPPPFFTFHASGVHPPLGPHMPS
eukprot:359925-Chlamydomonas_euryale.AAC.4